MFNSLAKQDEFVARILNFEKGGFYLDVGSHESQDSNNSFYFDQYLDWRGTCIEKSTLHNESYKNRKNCSFLNRDALILNYKEVLTEYSCPNIINYVSIDVDRFSVDVLAKFPFVDFKFKVLTIEHDAYCLGPKFRDKQREILNRHGYQLLCADVNVEQNGYGEGLPFEDWWVDETCFDKSLIEKIRSENESPSKIIAKFS